MKYKYVPVFISYDKVADKMNYLAAQGYEYDKEAIVAIRMGCILNPGHGKIPAPDFNFYI